MEGGSGGRWMVEVQKHMSRVDHANNSSSSLLQAVRATQACERRQRAVLPPLCPHFGGSIHHVLLNFTSQDEGVVYDLCLHAYDQATLSLLSSLP